MSAVILPLVALAALWEIYWWAARRERRAHAFACALSEARREGLPLVVVGAPDRGATGGYGCGDVTVDLGPSSCPRVVRADVCRAIPLPSDSAVVLVSCVLEYVSDLRAAVAEILRVSGGRVYVIGVEPWTLAAWLYPGTRRVGAARALAREVWHEGRLFRSTPFALPRGQGADYVAPLGRGRVHLQQFPDGRVEAHVDRFDPDRGALSSALHLLTDVPRAVASRPRALPGGD